MLPKYSRDVPMNSNEELDHRRRRDAAVVRPLLFSVFEYLQRYSTCLNVGCFLPMQTDANEGQVQDRPGECRDMAVAPWAERWNHCSGLSALCFRSFGKEMDLLYVRCRREVNYERIMVELLSWRHNLRDGTAHKLNPEYFMVSPPFIGLWFIDRHDYWECNCNLEKRMRSSRRLTRTVLR